MKKLIMLATTKANNSIIIHNNGKIKYWGENYFTQEYLHSINAKSYHFYLINTDAEIKEGDYVIDELGEVFGPYEEGDIIGKAGKILATTDISLRLPQLSEQSIKLAIDYFNRTGKKEVEVKVEYVKPKYPNSNFSKPYADDIIDITIPEEKIYSREEVCNILNKYRVYAWKVGSTAIDLEKFIEQNL